MDFAKHAATKSKDTTKVGAILVGTDGEVRLTAFNGVPRGVDDVLTRYDRPQKYMWCQHAERNLISFAARYGIATDGCRVYCTHFPCSQCAGALVQAGIKVVCVGDGVTNMPEEEFKVAEIMFDEAGVNVWRMK